MKSENDRKLEGIGRDAYESIAEMVAALQCDYDRLEELRDERDDWEPEDNDGQTWAEANPDGADELEELEKLAGGCKDADEARQRIEEGALSVDVRSGWAAPGSDMEPEEFCLLLATGGPAVRIIGELDSNCEPHRARLEVQDWFLPWTEYTPADHDVLLAYANCFYYGG